MRLSEFTLLVCLIATVVCYASNATAEASTFKPTEGFTTLFNGQDLEGWYGGETRESNFLKGKGEPDWSQYRYKMYQAVAKHWRIDGGALIARGDGPDLVTWSHYRDFELRLEWKISPDGESGISLRGFPGIAIWDTNSKALNGRGADQGSGGLIHNDRLLTPPTAVADKPTGQWNEMVVRMVGPYVTVILNNKEVLVNAKLPNAFKPGTPIGASGPIHLRVRRGEVSFKNIAIRKLSDGESNKVLDAINNDEDRYMPLFNDNNFAGWAGATHGFERIEAGIRSKRGTTHFMATQKQYRDFVIRFECKLPPGGNSGLILRSPGVNQPGLELQILDNSHPMYKQLKESQYHGSAYGIAAARRGYLRPTGQWNHHEVYLKGDHLRVLLNGYEILNCKLKDAAPNNANATRVEGHLGFYSHSDPVAFRNVQVKEID